MSDIRVIMRLIRAMKEKKLLAYMRLKDRLSE